MESSVERPWPFGIDVDGSLLFDVDANHLVANIDLHVPHRHWVVGQRLSWPSCERIGGLEFTENALETKSFETPVEAVTDVARKILEIRIGSSPANERHALSDSVLVGLHDGELVNIVARLDGAS